MRRKCLMLAAALCLCMMPAGRIRANEAARDSGGYAYDSGKIASEGEGGDAGMADYIYRDGGPDGRKPDQDAEEKEEGETLQDIGRELLDGNKINIAVLMILLASLGIVLYRNDKLTASGSGHSRKRERKAPDRR